LDWGGVFPEANLLESGIELGTELMDAGCALAIHDLAVLIEDGVDAIVLENAAGGDSDIFHFKAIEGFNGED
jgi:hypothetical protein